MPSQAFLYSLDAGVELAGAAEECVDHREHQRRLADDEARAAQRPHADDVEIRRHHQLAQERAVLLHLDGADGDFRALADEVEEAGTDVARKAFVDDFERRHAAAHITFVAREVVSAHAVGLRRCVGFSRFAFAADALQQGIDFVLRKNRVAHISRALLWGRAVGSITG
jgi:hypothetical protein